MEYIMEFKGDLGEVFPTIKVEVSPLVKQSTNEYYPNLTDCCKKAVKQKKFCSGCGNEVKGDFKFKGIKVEKEMKPFSNEQYERILESFNTKKICIEKVIEDREIEKLYLSDRVNQINQHEEYRGELYEQYWVLKESNLAFYGKTNIRNTPYQMVITADENGLIMRCLLEKNQIYDLKDLDKHPINLDVAKEKVDVLKIMKSKVDLEEFKNDRNAQIEELVMKSLNGEIPLENEGEVKIVKDVEAEKDKLEKLKALKEKLKSKEAVAVAVEIKAQ